MKEGKLELVDGRVLATFLRFFSEEEYEVMFIASNSSLFLYGRGLIERFLLRVSGLAKKSEEVAGVIERPALLDHLSKLKYLKGKVTVTYNTRSLAIHSDSAGIFFPHLWKRNTQLSDLITSFEPPEEKGTVLITNVARMSAVVKYLKNSSELIWRIDRRGKREYLYLEGRDQRDEPVAAVWFHPSEELRRIENFEKKVFFSAPFFRLTRALAKIDREGRIIMRFIKELPVFIRVESPRFDLWGDIYPS